jgi:transposase-like protein
LLLSGVVESDEAYIIAGHKGQPDKVKWAGRRPRRHRLKGKRGRGTSADEKNLVIGFVQRGGCVMLKVVPNVQQATIRPLFEQYVAPKTLINTDEYNIYNKLTAWGYEHKTVNHAEGEFARDEDGDGFYEVHCNTQEGIWSLLRSWLRPHRGVSQEKLPFYVGYFDGAVLTVVTQS